MKEEKIRLKGHMRTHKALIKSIICTRKFEISCISAPQPVKGREDGYCYMYIDGYPTEGKIKIDVIQSNSAAVGANCGAGSIGIMYANKPKE